jgi:hypothetical protein
MRAMLRVNITNIPDMAIHTLSADGRTSEAMK